MAEARSAQDTNKKSEHRPTKGLAWVVITWGRIVVGMGLAGEGAWMYAHAKMNVEGSV